MYRILRELSEANGLMFGEGTLEVLPDGFGFLRSPDYNYLPCPDDIYISPSSDPPVRASDREPSSPGRRARRSDERAVLRAVACRGHQLITEPDSMLTQKVVFDDLTPLHPDGRLKLETDPSELNTRVIDLITPIGKGQRTG